jgi:hypothetical protein
MRGQITSSTLAAVALVALGVSTAVAQAPPGASAGMVHELMRQPQADQPGTDVIVVTVDYPPGRPMNTPDILTRPFSGDR